MTLLLVERHPSRAFLSLWMKEQVLHVDILKNVIENGAFQVYLYASWLNYSALM